MGKKNGNGTTAAVSNTVTLLYHQAVERTQQGQFAEAERLCQQALQDTGTIPEIWLHLGMVQQQQGKLNEALVSYNTAIKLNPNYLKAYMHMADLLRAVHHFDQELLCHERVIALDPENPAAYQRAGVILAARGQEGEDKAIQYFEKALALDPTLKEASGELLFLYQRVCDWEAFAALEPPVDAMEKEGIAAGELFGQALLSHISRCDDVKRNFAVQQLLTKVMYDDFVQKCPFTPFDMSGRAEEKDILTLGYISGDFRDHAIGHLTRSLFGLHDRKRFRVVVYVYDKAEPNAYRTAIAAGADDFVDLAPLSHVEAARKIYDDGVDILVDATGLGRGSRQEILMQRPAPIQVSYLAFPCSTGAEWLDYIITDPVVTPEEHAPYYSETFACLPYTYVVTDNTQARPDPEVTREAWGLPAEGCVFASFSSSYKLDAVFFAVWMRLLTQVEGSVLWLYSDSETVQQNLRRAAEQHGVDPARVLFTGHVGKEEHLTRLSLVDVALDTRLYGGHTTTVDALWAGVPVVTLLGQHFASRACAGLLTALEMPELVTEDIEAYEALALQLGQDAKMRAGLKEKILKKQQTAPLFDTPRYVGYLEAAYQQMWQRYAAGEAPAMIRVAED